MIVCDEGVIVDFFLEEMCSWLLCKFLVMLVELFNVVVFKCEMLVELFVVDVGFKVLEMFDEFLVFVEVFWVVIDDICIESKVFDFLKIEKMDEKVLVCFLDGEDFIIIVLLLSWFVDWFGGIYDDDWIESDGVVVYVLKLKFIEFDWVEEMKLLIMLFDDNEELFWFCIWDDGFFENIVSISGLVNLGIENDDVLNNECIFFVLFCVLGVVVVMKEIVSVIGLVELIIGKLEEWSMLRMLVLLCNEWDVMVLVILIEKRKLYLVC